MRAHIASKALAVNAPPLAENKVSGTPSCRQAVERTIQALQLAPAGAPAPASMVAGVASPAAAAPPPDPLQGHLQQAAVDDPTLGGRAGFAGDAAEGIGFGPLVRTGGRSAYPVRVKGPHTADRAHGEGWPRQPAPEATLAAIRRARVEMGHRPHPGNHPWRGDGGPRVWSMSPTTGSVAKRARPRSPVGRAVLHKRLRRTLSPPGSARRTRGRRAAAGAVWACEAPRAGGWGAVMGLWGPRRLTGW